jgi:hypothetical protein
VSAQPNYGGRHIGNGRYLANVPTDTPVDPEVKRLVDANIARAKAATRAIKAKRGVGR